MRKSAILIGLMMLALGFLGSCNNSSMIGESIIEDKISVYVDSAFTLEGRSIDNPRVQSQTTAQMMGRIDCKGFGRLTSTVLTQFMPSSMFDAEITDRNIDSLVLVMKMTAGEFVGDSLVPMGINIYELNSDNLLKGPIYSNADPKEYYNPNKLLASKVFNVATTSADTTYNYGYREIRVQMPKEIGQRMARAYKENPANFSSPTAFAKNVFPGIYIENSFGTGRLTRVTSTIMSLYYRYGYKSPTTGIDTVERRQRNYLAVTPEIVTDNVIDLKIADDIRSRIEAGEAIMMGPAGLDIELTLPAPKIIESYLANKGNMSVINTLALRLPATLVENEYKLQMPKGVLLVLSKDKDTFFEKNYLPNGRTAFYAEYNTSTGTYDFTDMRQFIIDLIDKGLDKITKEDYTFTLTPVSAIYETNGSSSYYYYYGYSTAQTLSSIQPYVSAPIMCRFELDKAKIMFAFSTQTAE